MVSESMTRGLVSTLLVLLAAHGTFVSARRPSADDQVRAVEAGEMTMHEVFWRHSVGPCPRGGCPGSGINYGFQYVCLMLRDHYFLYGHDDNTIFQYPNKCHNNARWQLEYKGGGQICIKNTRGDSLYCDGNELKLGGPDCSHPNARFHWLLNGSDDHALIFNVQEKKYLKSGPDRVLRCEGAVVDPFTDHPNHDPWNWVSGWKVDGQDHWFPQEKWESRGEANGCVGYDERDRAQYQQCVGESHSIEATVSASISFEQSIGVDLKLAALSSSRTLTLGWSVAAGKTWEVQTCSTAEIAFRKGYRRQACSPKLSFGPYSVYANKVQVRCARCGEYHGVDLCSLDESVAREICPISVQ